MTEQTRCRICYVDVANREEFRWLEKVPELDELIEGPGGQFKVIRIMKDLGDATRPPSVLLRVKHVPPAPPSET